MGFWHCYRAAWVTGHRRLAHAQDLDAYRSRVIWLAERGWIPCDYRSEDPYLGTEVCFFRKELPRRIMQGHFSFCVSVGSLLVILYRASQRFEVSRNEGVVISSVVGHRCFETFNTFLHLMLKHN